MNLAANEVKEPLQIEAPPSRCVIVVDKNLQPGYCANAVAVTSLTIGQRHPELVGEPLIDKSGFAHPGLIPIGITVLATAAENLPELRKKGLDAGLDIIAFPVEGQRTTDYQSFKNTIAALEPTEIDYLAVAFVGPKKTVSKIIGKLALLS